MALYEANHDRRHHKGLYVSFQLTWIGQIKGNLATAPLPATKDQFLQLPPKIELGVGSKPQHFSMESVHWLV